MVLLVSLGAALTVWNLRRTADEAAGREAAGRGELPGPAPPGETVPSIAVLPFVDMSPGGDQEYFSDGLAEELLNSLAQIGGLKVAARTSSFQFKGRAANIAEIGRQLNVTSILEGSVRKAGNRVRITAQLVDVADGFHLWSNTFDRELTDIFAVQEDIARAVAEALQVTLLRDRATAARSAADSPEAYSAYLQGKYFFKRFNRENLERSIGYYEQSLELDPDFAPAWAGLAFARLWKAGNWDPTPEAWSAARAAADRALELDDELADGWAARGSLRLWRDWDWAGAQADVGRALELRPGDADITLEAADLARTLDRSDEALRLIRRAIELDPLNSNAYQTLGWHALWADRPEETIAAVEKALELDPNTAVAHKLLAEAYLVQGEHEAALAELELEPDPFWRGHGRVLSLQMRGRAAEAEAALAELSEEYREIAAFQIAELHAHGGDADRAFAWLETAYEQRDPGLSALKADRWLTSLQDDPRWPVLLDRMNLPR